MAKTLEQQVMEAEDELNSAKEAYNKSATYYNSLPTTPIVPKSKAYADVVAKYALLKVAHVKYNAIFLVYDTAFKLRQAYQDTINALKEAKAKAKQAYADAKQAYADAVAALAKARSAMMSPKAAMKQLVKETITG